MNLQDLHYFHRIYLNYNFNLRSKNNSTSYYLHNSLLPDFDQEEIPITRVCFDKKSDASACNVGLMTDLNKDKQK